MTLWPTVIWFLGFYALAASCGHPRTIHPYLWYGVLFVVWVVVGSIILKHSKPQRWE
jgi:hypothetical protein